MSESNDNESEQQHEAAYDNGQRMAYTAMLRECLMRLGYHDPFATHARWIIEREEAIATLRRLCSDFGDNDWEPTLNMSDIIEKHLGNYLE